MVARRSRSSATGCCSPPDSSVRAIDPAWRRVASLVRVWTPIAEMETTMNIIGTWAIQSSPDFDDSYLHLERPAYVTLRRAGDRIAGEYHVGVQAGSIDGREQPDGSILFSFEGMDEMDEVNGAGTITLDNNRLTLTLRYHQGDDYTFEATRPG